MKRQVLDLNNVSSKKKTPLKITQKIVASQSFSGSQCNFKLFLQIHNLKLIDKPGKYDMVFNMC